MLSALFAASTVCVWGGHPLSLPMEDQYHRLYRQCEGLSKQNTCNRPQTVCVRPSTEEQSGQRHVALLQPSDIFSSSSSSVALRSLIQPQHTALGQSRRCPSPSPRCVRKWETWSNLYTFLLCNCVLSVSSSDVSICSWWQLRANQLRLDSTFVQRNKTTTAQLKKKRSEPCGSFIWSSVSQPSYNSASLGGGHSGQNCEGSVTDAGG